MAYMCEQMKGTVVYDQKAFSFTPTQCRGNLDHLYAKTEMSAHPCGPAEEMGKIVAHPTRGIIKDMSK